MEKGVLSPKTKTNEKKKKKKKKNSLPTLHVFFSPSMFPFMPLNKKI
jgi:hypothetical protein